MARLEVMVVCVDRLVFLLPKSIVSIKKNKKQRKKNQQKTQQLSRLKNIHYELNQDN